MSTSSGSLPSLSTRHTCNDPRASHDDIDSALEAATKAMQVRSPTLTTRSTALRSGHRPMDDQSPSGKRRCSAIRANGYETDFPPSQHAAPSPQGMDVRARTPHSDTSLPVVVTYSARRQHPTVSPSDPSIDDYLQMQAEMQQGTPTVEDFAVDDDESAAGDSTLTASADLPPDVMDSVETGTVDPRALDVRSSRGSL